MSELVRERAFVRRIERRFLALREGGLYLSPRDFELLLDWYHRGIPSQLVIDAMDRVFAKSSQRSTARRIQSIFYCRHAVEEAWEERRAALFQSPTPASHEKTGVFTTEEIEGHLEKCALATRTASQTNPDIHGRERGRTTVIPIVPPDTTPVDSPHHTPVDSPHTTPVTSPPATPLASPSAAPVRHGDQEAADPVNALETVADRLFELRDQVRSGPLGDLPRMEDELVLLEKRAIEAAREAISKEDLDRLEAAVFARIEPFAARMSDKARAATLRRAIDAAVRERLHLPRFSLFTIAR